MSMDETDSTTTATAVAAIDALGESFRRWLETEYAPLAEAARLAERASPRTPSDPLELRQARRRNAHVLKLAKVLELARTGRRTLEVVDIPAVSP